ncbi:DUF4010 domain-containing protein [Sandaracinobacter neustonicus]|uniref:DUF4010 domain-containing protein n=1 Tax=Sandaracinobacter neustonicus TaxID=1715348 RepID=A0A501XP47_9SPHN|nr:DUF4010 domain-containing protein [Sandaracinobacter neustonicus]TPE62215.1 DUF4010 domain-containing protein [Sandaracinobacter neustonicus]
MLDLAQLRPLAFALAIGLIIGLQRGWQARAEPTGRRVAGFRTFGLLGLAGGLAALLPLPFGTVILAAAAAMLIVGYVRESSSTEYSATTAIAGVLTLGLGAFAAMGRETEAMAAAAVMMLLLALKHRLHHFLRGVSATEIEAASRFAIVALVILPLMPDKAYGPFEAWNPRQLWTVVVVVLALSFAGYVATRRLGPSKGLLITAAAGALVSSTAVTASYARQLKEDSPAVPALIAGIALASAISYGRLLLLAALLTTAAAPTLAIAIVPAGLVAVAAAWIVARRAEPQVHEGELALGNPLNFGSAFGLAGFVALLSALSRWALDHFGGAGIGIVLLLTGLADVDAAVLTLAALPPQNLAPDRAGLLLTLPVIANMTVKIGLVLVNAPNRRGLKAALPLLATTLATALGAAFLALR